MNRNEFCYEVKSSNLCPNDFDDVYEEFCRYQDLALGALNAFHDICEKNGVRYQLAFGSLLGAIRDHGQIPWDYDVDVIVPYAERFKLIDSLKRDLPEGYYFYCPETNPSCRHKFTRVTPKGYRSDRIHVDVFYVIGAPVSEQERKDFDAQMKKYLRLRYIKLVRINEYPSNAYRSKLVSIKNKIKNIFIPLDKINSELEKICEYCNPEETGITIPVISAYKYEPWRTSDLWDTELLSTDFGTFRISKHYDEILTKIYKDYRKIFPLQNRIDEIYRSYYLIKYNKKVSCKKSAFRYYIDN